MQILKEPMVQFVVLGALIFAGYAAVRPADEIATNEIRVDTSTQTWMRDNFQKQFGRAPGPDEMQALVQNYIDTEVKYRVATAMGLAEQDSIVRRRMAQKFDFLFGGAADDATPEDAVLRAWYEARLADYTLPGTVSLEQIWFSPDTRSDPQTDARDAVNALRDGETAIGDAPPFRSDFEALTPVQLRNRLGDSFAEAAFALTVGEWQGPVISGLGVHAVRVTSRVEPTVIPFHEIREVALVDWRDAESARLLSETLEELKRDYTIVVDDPSAPAPDDENDD